MVGSLALGAVPTAVAHDHVPPKVSLRVGGKEQRGSRGTTHWETMEDDGSCLGWTADSVWHWPPGVEVDRGRVRARLELKKEQEPTRVTIDGWREVDEYDAPEEGHRRYRFRLRHVQSEEGDSRWVAIFRPRVADDLYIQAYAEWADTEGCSGTQYAWWSFHLRGKEPRSPG
jgi:hypothetical protein